MDIANKIAHLAGIPRDFKLHAVGPPQPPGMPPATPGQTPQMPASPGRPGDASGAPAPDGGALSPQQAQAHALLTAVIHQVLPAVNNEIAPIAKTVAQLVQQMDAVMKIIQASQNVDQDKPVSSGCP